jgi:hypothetical protein
MSVKAGSQTALTAQGDEKMAGGKITAMSLNEQAAGINLQFLLVDENVYVKLPANLNKSGKPWQKATKGSTNPVLKQLATSMSSVLESASVGQYAAFASSSTVKTIGVEQVNGTTATHYKLMVDITKVRSASITPAVKQALAKAGIKKIPVDMWVDGEGRPVKVSETITLQGQAVSTNVNLTKVNEPVTITAPPASQVATS